MSPDRKPTKDEAFNRAFPIFLRIQQRLERERQEARGTTKAAS